MKQYSYFFFASVFLFSSCMTWSYRYNSCVVNPYIEYPEEESHGVSSIENKSYFFKVHKNTNGSIAAAAKNGNIKKINRVEYEKIYTSFLGFIPVGSKYVTHVYGIPNNSSLNNTPQAKSNASIDIISDNNCRVYDNGVFVGMTEKQLQGFAEGLHNIEIRQEGYAIYSEAITISSPQNNYSIKSVNKKLTKDATFPGGITKLNEYLIENIQDLVSNTPSRIEIGFVITEKGEIKDIELLTNVSKPVEVEMIRMVQRMPKWIPAQLDGKDISSWNVIPINFQ